MAVSSKDREILRELGRKVAEVAALPAQQETIGLWKALNGLRPVRPMVAADQIPWHEMDVEHELTLECQDDWCRRVETQLRRTLYRWKHMAADMVVEPYVDLRKVIHDDGFGLDIAEDIAVSDPQNDVRGHYYKDSLQTEEDLARIHTPNIRLDAKATADLEAKARGIFDGILGVRMCGYETWFRPWDQLTQCHSVEATLYDLADRPEFLHEYMRRMTRASLEMLDRLEADGLLQCPMSWVHCTGAFSDELPAAGFDGKPRAKDVWTAGMAQIFASVSPEMHEEFEIAYGIEWYRRFGLGYYGCCEPLDKKVHVIRKLPNVRKISMSPWVEVETGAAAIGKDYVFSRKPSPATLAVDTWDTAPVVRDLKETLAACRRHGCPVELILKDISTVRYQPQRLWEWVNVAMRLVRDAG